MMRLIARLDVKNEFVIKGIHLEGLRKIGDPNELARRYYQQGIDEIVFMDAVASLYDRNNLFEVIEAACRDVFIPITLGGGLRSLGDIEAALKAGADKVAINTAAVRNPGLIAEAARHFGSQCIVASIEAKKQASDDWEAYIDNGREKTGIEVTGWTKKLQDLGAGEIFLTSIDREGTRRGFDLQLSKAVNEAVSIPVIASGGCGRPDHITALADVTAPSAVALASVLHYGTHSIFEVKQAMAACGLAVRELAA